MFVFQGRRYANPEAWVDEIRDYAYLTPEEIQRIPWNRVRTNGTITWDQLLVHVPDMMLSARFPDFHAMWLEDTYEREIAVLMTLHPRLGVNSPLRLLDPLVIQAIITQSMD